MARIYLAKLKKEMTECRIIQVDKKLKSKHRKINLKYSTAWNAHLKLKCNIINLYLKITTGCNLNCSFCSQSCDKKKIVNMPFKDAKFILDEAKKFGILNVYYTGGEPLVNPYIVKMLQYGYGLGFNQALITNATLISQHLQVLNYINKVGISLLGTEQTYDKICQHKGAFAKVMKGINSVKNKTIPIDINYTLCDDNINDENLLYVADLCKRENFKLYVARLNYIGNAKKLSMPNVNKMCKLVNDLNTKGYDIRFSNCVPSCSIDDKYSYLSHGCGAGISMCAVDTTLNVYECPSSNKIIGNLKKQSFKQVFAKYKRYLRKYYDNLPAICKNCKYLISCRGGCKVEIDNGYSNDYYLNKQYSNFKDKMMDCKLQLKVNKVVIKNKSIILPNPLRILDCKYLNILQKLDGSLTGYELLKQVDEKQEIIELLFLLFKDKYLYMETCNGEGI